MKRKTIIIISAVVVLLVVLTAVGRNRKKAGIEVNVSNIEERTIVSTVTANGKIRPEGEVKISPDVSGEIIDLYVAEGDTVTEGQLLLRINPDLYMTALDRAKANLNGAQSTYKSNQAMLTQSESRFNELEISYNRSVKLFEDGVISSAEFESAKSGYLVSQGDVKAATERVSAAQFGIANAEATLTEARKNLQRTTIFAPTGGVVSALNSEKGERVVGTAQMAGTEIMIISNFNNMEVIVDVNENDILQITLGDTAIIEVDAYSERKFKGIVTEIAKSAKSGLASAVSRDQVTNFEVKIRLMKDSYEDLLQVTDAPFLPGMSANVDIQTETRKNIQCLPIEAVSTREKEIADSTVRTSGSEDELDEVVFSIKNGKAVKHIVKTGIQDSRYIEILSGLDSLKTVITGPYDAISKKLKDGKEVKEVEAKSFEKLEE